MADDASRLLRRALRANAIFSALSGGFMLVADGLVAAILGAYTELGAIHFVGLNLLLFSALLVWLAKRDSLTANQGLAVVGADLLWVIASWIAMGAHMVTGQAAWAVAIVADIVLIFAIVQFIGVRRMRAAPASA